MRVNVYAEEMTDRIEIIGKEIDGHVFTGLRLYLELPATIKCPVCGGAGKLVSVPVGRPPIRCHICKGEGTIQAQAPFMHRPGDDDSSAVTFWGKRDLRVVLRMMLTALDEHYGDTDGA